MQRLALSYEYPVYFTTDVFDPANPALAEVVGRAERTRRHRIFAVVDSGVAQAWPHLGLMLARYANAYRHAMDLCEPPEVIDGGERVKNDPRWLRRLRARFQEVGIDRQSFVIVIGGGAVLDVTGYAAATTHRGVRLIRLPTTVLAQSDSGIGVKNAVNAFGIKNFVGTFSPPFAVINDSRFLETLDERDRIAGMAEAVKVSLIRDRSFFDWLVDHAAALAACDVGAVAHMVRRGAELHLHHIGTSGDPFEFGNSRPLDFGHWAAHKLEALSKFRLRHGEAVAIGMALDACYSVDVGLLDEADRDAICALLERLGLPLWDAVLEIANTDGRPELLRGLAEFREHLGGELKVSLLAGIGCSVEAEQVDTDRVRLAIDWLRQRYSRQ